MTSSAVKMLLLPLVLEAMVMMTYMPTDASRQSQDAHPRDFDDGEEIEPEFMDTPTQVTVKQGALAILHCWVRHLGDRKVVWRRVDDDTFLTIGKVTWALDSNLVLEHLRKRNGVSSWDLIFRQARLDHAGDYECQVTSQDSYVRTVTLVVLDEPQFGSQMILLTGQTLRLFCNVSAKEMVDSSGLYWEKDGRAIDSILHPFIYTTRHLEQSTQMFVADLTIDSVSLDDSGVYTCTSSSRKVVDSINVTVIKSNPTNSKRDEAKGTQTPDSPGEMLEDQKALEEENQHVFSTDKLKSTSLNSSSCGMPCVISRQAMVGCFTVYVLQVLLWQFVILLDYHIPIILSVFEAS